MWMVKEGVVYERSEDFERFYLEDERGTKLIFLRFDGRLGDGQEEFEYREGDLSFEVGATRVDLDSGIVGDVYTVWLGHALKIACRGLPPNTLTLDHARGIAQNIKQALLVWRYTGSVADALSCHTPARDVVFMMKQWDKWDSSLDGRWP